MGSVMDGMKWELNGLMRDWNLSTTFTISCQSTPYKHLTKPALLSRERGTIARQKGYFYAMKGQVLQNKKTGSRKKEHGWCRRTAEEGDKRRVYEPAERSISDAQW